jgi:hypothetical protein
VAIDTLAIRVVPVDELGSVNGWMQTGMLGGRALVAAGAVMLAAAGFEGAVVVALLVFIWGPLAALVAARPDETEAQAGQRPGSFTLGGLLAWSLLPGLWIALTVGAGFEFFTVTAGPLLQELGGNAGHTAFLFSAVAPAGLALGALLGGSVASGRGAYTATTIGTVTVAAAVAVFAALQTLSATMPIEFWFLPFTAIYVASGFLICSSYALFMQVSRGDFAATRFSLFMSATNGCEAWAAFAGGRLAGVYGHTGAMLILVAVSMLALPGLLIARILTGNPDVDRKQEA